MPALSAILERRVRELARALDTLPERLPSALPTVLPALQSLLEADTALSYGLAPAERGVRLEFLHQHGTLAPDVGDGFARWLETAPPRWGDYDPLQPEPWQRNVALRFHELRRAQPEPPPLLRDAWGSLGLAGADQVRVLVCDGATLLAWVGGLRAAPFEPHERELLERLAPALRRRLALESRLRDATVANAALATALEALPSAAFVTTAGGRVRHANTAGRALFDRRPAEVTAALAACAQGRASELPFTLTRLALDGAQAHFLAVLHAPDAEFLARAARAAQRWNLTPRQREVLAQLARGRSNKLIAVALGCAESTVEVHVTALLQKAGVEQRSALVARFWTDDA